MSPCENLFFKSSTCQRHCPYKWCSIWWIRKQPWASRNQPTYWLYVMLETNLILKLILASFVKHIHNYLKYCSGLDFLNLYVMGKSTTYKFFKLSMTWTGLSNFTRLLSLIFWSILTFKCANDKFKYERCYLNIKNSNKRLEFDQYEPRNISQILLVKSKNVK